MSFDPERHHRRSVRLQGYRYDAGTFFTNPLRWDLDPDNPDSSVMDEFDVWLIGDGGRA